MTWWRDGRRMTENCHRTLKEARLLARRQGSSTVEPQHVLMALLGSGENAAVLVLRGVCGGVRRITDLVRAATRQENAVCAVRRPVLGPDTWTLLDIARGEAMSLGHACIATEHVLLAFLRDENSPLVAALRKEGYGRSRVLKEIREVFHIGEEVAEELPPAFLPVPRPRREDFPPDVRFDPALDFWVRMGASMRDEEYAAFYFVQNAWRRKPATRDQLGRYIVEEYAESVRILQAAERDQDGAPDNDPDNAPD